MLKFNFKVIDLTHTLSPDIPYWEGDCGFKLSIETDYKDYRGPDVFRTQQIQVRAGTGTHIDAPAHCFANAKTIDALSMEELIMDCIVIRVDHEADENYIIMPEVVERFEKEYGEIQSNTFVIFYTGWNKYWNTPVKYHNNHKFPSVHESTAKLLLQRNIRGLGIDTLSADTGVNGFPVHRIVLGADKYLVENIANTGELPLIGAKIFVMPLKIKDATESPIRLIALIREKRGKKILPDNED